MRPRHRPLRSFALAILASTVALPAGAQSSFDVDFYDARGNEWWVEIETASTSTVLAVDARVDEGAWQPLARTDWGSWADSFFVPSGSVVDFRATATDGAVARSGLYEWPSGELLQPPPTEPEPEPTEPPPEEPPPEEPPPEEPPPEESRLEASFEDARGNEWWVEVEVRSTLALARVEARVDEGAWRTLDATGWGSFASSFFVPSGSLVDFRATATSGASALSGLYEWPSAALVAPPPDEGEEDPPPEEPPPPPPPSGSVDVAIVVDVTAGPGGAAAPVLLDGGVLGVSIPDWTSGDYRPAPDPDYLAYLRGLRPAYLRWPGGHSSQRYVFVRTSGTGGGLTEITPAHVDDFIALADAVGAAPLIGINLKTAPPENAADLVRYLNVEKGYGVRWFQLGNEPDHEDGLTSSPEQHAQRHLRAVAAMKAVDPDIRIVGPEIMTCAHCFGVNGQDDWMSPILDDVGHTLDGVSWHRYQLYSGQTDPRSSSYMTLENLFQEEAPDWSSASLDFAAQIMPLLDGAIDRRAPGAKVWITEFGEDPGYRHGAGLADTMAGAVWAADALGRFLRHGPAAILKWKLRQQGSALTLLDDDGRPRPEYLVWWLYARHFGDEVGDARSSSITEVNAHASWRPDGKLAVMLANKATSARTVRLELEGLTPTSGQRYDVRGDFDGYDATRAHLNGHTLTPALAVDGVPGTALPASALTVVELAPVSVVLVVYE